METADLPKLGISFPSGIGKKMMNQQLFKCLATSPDHFPYGKNQSHTIFLITGDSGTGKTTWCRQWRNSAQTIGWRVGGLLSIPVMADQQKVAITLMDVATGEQRPLAKLSQQETQTATSPHSPRVTTGRWLFDPAVLDWGNEVLQRITAVDLLIIDELGPLEFEQGGGLQVAFPLLTTAYFQAAAVVIRPSLLNQAQQCWPDAQPIAIAQQNTALMPQLHLNPASFLQESAV